MGIGTVLQIVIGLLSSVLNLLTPGTVAATEILAALQLIQAVLAKLPATGALPI